MSKKRPDPVALFALARSLADDVLRDDPGVEDRAGRTAAGLAALWPAPLHACLLRGPDEAGWVVLGEGGHRRPDWQEGLLPALTHLADAGDGTAGAAPLDGAFDLPDHFLHGVAVAAGPRRFGALALALHKRTADAALAQALLTYLADHLGFRLARDEEGRPGEARFRDLADLTNLVGHEVNNALNGIGLQIAALGTRGLSAQSFPELREVRRQVAEAGAMVRRLQDLCLGGAAAARLRSADLNRAAAAAAADPALAGRVRLALGPDLPPVRGTPLDLERLAGVLFRAAAAAGPGEISARTGRGEGGAVWLRVEDAGAGPDGALLPRLFEPFVAVRAGDDGIGLALAKAITRRLGGGVEGGPRPGGGMAFVAELRAADGPGGGSR